MTTEFRKQLIDEHINVGIAFQIRSLRNRQNLTQAKLAEKLGGKKKQPMVAEWENPNYGKYTLGTLKELQRYLTLGCWFGSYHSARWLIGQLT